LNNEIVLRDFINTNLKFKVASAGDVHGEVNKVAAYARDCISEPKLSLVVATGDYTPRETSDEKESEEGIREALEPLRQIPRQVLVLGGNYDIPGMTGKVAGKIGKPLTSIGSKPTANGKPYPGNSIDCNDYLVVGIEGSNPINGRFPGERSENELEWGLDEAFRGASSLGPHESSRMVVVTHPPPYQAGTRDQLGHVGLPTSYWGKHVGSTAILKFVQKQKPLLNICGHIHEGVGATFFIWDHDNGAPKIIDRRMEEYEKIVLLYDKKTTSATACVNHGTLENWNYMLYKISEKGSIVAVEISKRRPGGKDGITRFVDSITGRKNKVGYTLVVDPDELIEKGMIA
jgi:Icc-related predicted phosphoesterase